MLYLTTILKFIWKYKLLLILALVVIISGIAITTFQANQKLKAEIETNKNNIQIITNDYSVDTYRTTNNKLVNKVRMLELSQNSLESYNNTLLTELRNMKIKLRNVNNILQVNNKYIASINDISISKPKIIRDTIYPDYDMIYEFDYTDNYLKFEGDLLLTTIDNPKEYNPKITNVNINIIDTLTIVEETKYKRYWIFWKKPVGIDLHIKSENPYNKIDMVKSYKFKK